MAPALMTETMLKMTMPEIVSETSTTLSLSEIKPTNSK